MNDPRIEAALAEIETRIANETKLLFCDDKLVRGAQLAVEIIRRHMAERHSIIAELEALAGKWEPSYNSDLLRAVIDRYKEPTP